MAIATAPAAAFVSPAALLTGVTVDGGWKVVKRIDRPDHLSGGFFSVGYEVEKDDGSKGFLKALDIFKAWQPGMDPALLLQAMTHAFNFEREVCRKCADQRLTRVCAATISGSVNVVPGFPAGEVQYLIFDRAEGDIRKLLDGMKVFDIAWTLRTLHQVATGLRQLHGVGIVHQDLKPSNVLTFPGFGSKVADLGRASATGIPSPHDTEPIAGDLGYAPPELGYDFDAGEVARRFGCDAYLLGSLIVFFFAKANMTGLLLSHLNPAHHWDNWTAGFEAALPYLREAFGRAMADVEAAIPLPIRADIVLMIRQLCEPDPRLRGHPNTRAGSGNPYSVERYISWFDKLASAAEHNLLGS